MKIKWNEVTRLSQIVAVVLFVVVFFVGFVIGRKFDNVSVLGAPQSSAKFLCDGGAAISVDFYKNFARIETAVLGTVYLPQTMSASGARYANADESIVFWNKGNTAFITQGDPNNVTYKNCVAGSQGAR